MNQKTIFVSIALILLLAFGMATLIYQNHQASLQDSSLGQTRGLAQREGAPVKGPADAKVTIVEFFDPACETCRDFYPFINQLLGRYPGKVNVMMRFAPLHTGSDQVVKMLEAARLQGQFWQALEILFKNQDQWIVGHTSQPMRALNILYSLDIDQQKLASDMNSPEVARIIQQDVQDAQALGVRATPEFFVNGRPMPSFGYEQLEQLVRQAVTEAY
jgi:protein-disulfide isomerase